MWLITLLFFLLHGCVEEEHPFNLPYAPVNFVIDINGIDSDLHDLSYKLFHQGRAAREHVGFGGLLIFKNHDGDIFAFDLSCPYEQARDVWVKPNDNWEAECSVCGSKYEIFYGSGQRRSGPADKGLQKYQVIPDTHPKGRFLIKNH